MTTTDITGEVFGKETDAPKAYLAEAAQKPFTELLPAYQESHIHLVTALAGVSEAQSRFTPSTGEGEDAWGIAQVVRHLSGSQVRFARRVLNLASGVEMGPPAPTVGDDDPRSIMELTSALEESSREMVRAVKSVEGHEDVAKTWNHPFFGEINCRALVALQTLHDNDHARQIDRIKALPGYPKA
jgi:hypothetical protein